MLKKKQREEDQRRIAQAENMKRETMMDISDVLYDEHGDYVNLPEEKLWTALNKNKIRHVRLV